MKEGAEEDGFFDEGALVGMVGMKEGADVDGFFDEGALVGMVGITEGHVGASVEGVAVVCCEGWLVGCPLGLCKLGLGEGASDGACVTIGCFEGRLVGRPLGLPVGQDEG